LFFQILYGIVTKVKHHFTLVNFRNSAEIDQEVYIGLFLFNEAQIRNILVEYIGYYNEKRPYQGIAEELTGGYTPQKQGRVIGCPVLSGLHHHFISCQKQSRSRTIPLPDLVFHPHGQAHLGSTTRISRVRKDFAC